MFLINKHTEYKSMNSIKKASFQIDEDEEKEGIILKATTTEGIMQVQFQLTKFETKILTDYLKERKNGNGLD